MLKKCLNIALCCILLQSTAFSQWTNVYEISGFGKLMESHKNPFLVSNDGGIDARNLRANDQYGSLSKRTPMLEYGSAGSYEITGLYRYYQTTGDKFLIAGGSTYLKSDKNNSGSFIIIRDELSDGERWQFVTYQDSMIAVNGANNPQKYDGHTQTTDDTDGSRTENILTADLGAPYAELNTGANLDASSWYQYKVAFYNGSVYYYSTARSNPIQTGSSVQDITLTDIPFGPAGTTDRYIYRTVGKSTRALCEAETIFYLVGTIEDNTTETFDDDMTDDDADDDATPTWSTVSAGSNVTPPIAKFAEIHKERLWFANNPTYESDVYWSYVYKPDIFNASDYEPIREDDGDEITFIKNLGGGVVIGKTNSIMKFSTIAEDSDNWYVLGPYSHIGCQAPYSAANTPLGIIYLSKNGLYVFDGSNSQLISDVVTDKIRDVLWSNRENVSAIYWDNQYQMAYTSTESGSSINNKVLVFNITRNAYEIDDKKINVLTVFNSGSDEGTIYSGSSDYDGYIYAHADHEDEVVYRSKSGIKEGTMESVGVLGEEFTPSIELTWGITCNDSSLSGITTDSVTLAGAITDRPSTSGYWYSPVVQIDATDLDKLYWSESLGGYGNVTLAIRTGASEAACESASWSSEFSSPAGSDISGESANDYIQIRATLTSTNILYTPKIVNSGNYNIRLTYSKEGSLAETSIPTLYKTGWTDLGVGDRRKRIWEIEIFYKGDEGDFDFNLTNLNGDIDETITIDLSVDPSDDNNDNYFGNSELKSYIWRPSITDNTPIGFFWQYEISDDGITEWQIEKIKTRFSVEDIY